MRTRALIAAAALGLGATACTPVILEDGSWYVPSEPSGDDITERRLYVGGCIADRLCDDTPGDDTDNQPEVLWCLNDRECSVVSGIYDGR